MKKLSYLLVISLSLMVITSCGKDEKSSSPAPQDPIVYDQNYYDTTNNIGSGSGAADAVQLFNEMISRLPQDLQEDIDRLNNIIQYKKLVITYTNNTNSQTINVLSLFNLTFQTSIPASNSVVENKFCILAQSSYISTSPLVTGQGCPSFSTYQVGSNTNLQNLLTLNSGAWSIVSASKANQDTYVFTVGTSLHPLNPPAAIYVVDVTRSTLLNPVLFRDVATNKETILIPNFY